jgi:hypothetical protein
LRFVVSPVSHSNLLLLFTACSHQILSVSRLQYNPLKHQRKQRYARRNENEQKVISNRFQGLKNYGIDNLKFHSLVESLRRGWSVSDADGVVVAQSKGAVRKMQIVGFQQRRVLCGELIAGKSDDVRDLVLLLDFVRL